MLSMFVSSPIIQYIGEVHTSRDATLKLSSNYTEMRCGELSIRWDATLCPNQDLIRTVTCSSDILYLRIVSNCVYTSATCSPRGGLE